MAVIARLNCGHHIEYGSSTAVPNPSGSEEQCPECESWELITQEWKEQWNAVCQSFPCTYSTHHGFYRKGADNSRARHIRSTGHTVSVSFFSYAPSTAKREVKARQRRQRSLRNLNSLPPNAPPPF